MNKGTVAVGNLFWNTKRGKFFWAIFFKYSCTKKCANWASNAIYVEALNANFSRQQWRRLEWLDVTAYFIKLDKFLGLWCVVLAILEHKKIGREAVRFYILKHKKEMCLFFFARGSGILIYFWSTKSERPHAFWNTLKIKNYKIAREWPILILTVRSSLI